MPTITRTLLNVASKLPISLVSKEVLRVPAVGETQLALGRHVATLAASGITDISTLGTLTLSGNVAPALGILKPQQNVFRSTGMFQSAYQVALPAPGGPRALVAIGGTLNLLDAQPLVVAQQPPHLITSPLASPHIEALTASVPLNTAYLVANELVFQDNTNVVLLYPNMQCVIICKKLTVGNNVTFTWQRPTPDPASLPHTPGTPNKPSAQPIATTIDSPATGTAGTAGAGGGSAPGGNNAPAIEIWTLTMNGSPAIDLGGEGYDPIGAPYFKGGRGGDGGSGGDGAPGRPDATKFGFCTTGPGNGGNGGKGGRAGDGGPGGHGGDGGRFSFYAPQSVLSSYQASFYVNVSGGIGGPGGDAGTPGPGGSGGARDDNSNRCSPGNDANGRPQVRSAGQPGATGDPGGAGQPAGSGGRGAITMQPVDEAMWKDALLKPAITNLSSQTAKEGDTISATGMNFASSDVVLVDGNAAQTTYNGDALITFVVPAALGGQRAVQVKQADGTVSNMATLYVIATVAAAQSSTPASAAEGRLRPGSTVRLTGTGFAQGMRVVVGGQDMTNVAVTDSHTAQFTLARPNSAPSNPDGEPVSLNVVLPQASPWATSNSIQIVLETFLMLVCGDSIAWGQGLHENEKFHSLVEQTVRSRHGDIGVYKTVLSHSGATIGVHPPDDEPLPALNGEVPTSFPTVPRQFTLFTHKAEEVDLILVDGGINDANVTTILNPLTDPATLTGIAETVCHGDMRTMLGTILGRFSNARVIVTGYYAILSHQSNTLLIDALCIGLGLDLGGIDGAIVGGVIAAATVDKIVSNCATFATQANLKLQQAVNDANAALPAGTPARVFFADPMFGPQNSALAPQAFVYGINADLSPQDPADVSSARAVACQASAARTTVDICKRASIGHPNPLGAQAYANAIIPKL